jgi:hypothetical protein
VDKQKAAAKEPVPAEGARPRKWWGKARPNDSTDPQAALHHSRTTIRVSAWNLGSELAFFCLPTTPGKKPKLNCHHIHRIDASCQFTTGSATSKAYRHAPDRSCNLNLRRPTQTAGTSLRLAVGASGLRLAGWVLCREEACTVEDPYSVIVEAWTEEGQLLCSVISAPLGRSAGREAGLKASVTGSYF